MPTYEYLCRGCGEHLDVVQSFHDAPLTTCPKCGGELRKVFGNVGIVFKGSGFYKTDSRSSGGKVASSKATSSTDASPKSESSSAPASEGASSPSATTPSPSPTPATSS